MHRTIVPLSEMLDPIEERTGAKAHPDMESGLEHMGRSISRSVDVMLVVVEPEPRKAAELLYDHIELKRKALGT